MITPMKKYSFLVYHQEYEEFLEKLKEIGVLHVIEKKTELPEDIREQYQYIDQVEKCIKFLKKREIEPEEGSSEQNGEELFNEITSLQQEEEQKKHSLKALQKEINELWNWGDFSLDVIEKLEANGLNVRFFIAPSRQFDPKWHHEYTLEEISAEAGNIYFVVIQKEDEQIDIEAEEVKKPKKTLSQLIESKKEIEQSIEQTGKRFDQLAKTAVPALERYKTSLIENLEDRKTKFNTSSEAEDKLRVIEGWVPEEKEEEINKYLDETGAVYIVSTPSGEEVKKVPIQLKNKKFPEKFEVLSELYSLPKYTELDMTPFFAPFYALFFGFCLGDAGYGILMAIAAQVGRMKMKKEMKKVMGLVFYLGIATLFFGLLTGTVFGVDLYAYDLPFYASVNEYIEAHGYEDVNYVLFYLSLILGGIQILFGMVLKAVNEIMQFGWKFAVGTLGWIILVVGMVAIYAVNEFAAVPMETLTPAIYTVLIVAGLMILFLNNLNRNVMVNFGLGLWNTYQTVTGLIGDLLSYIRLFALGVSSAILGYVFNSLAVAMSGSIPVLSILIMVVILVIGHSINLFMSGLGAFVHPLRLTFVEFYRNAGFAGGGKPYNPYRKLI